MKTLVVTEIKKSIEIMDEFVDEDYDYLELQNWFGVIDSKNREFTVYDNSGRMQISLIVSKTHDFDKHLCEYEPTMTEVRQMMHQRPIYLDFPYPDGTMSQILRDACKVWKKDVFIPLNTEICLRAQTSYNRMDYGCEWLGGGDWEEKTMYGETTDFFIVGIILREPYKFVHQEALEILTDLKNQRDELADTIKQMTAALKSTGNIVIHKVLGRSPREGRICEATGDKIIVEFEGATSAFIFPDCFYRGFLSSPKYADLIEKTKQMNAELENQTATIKTWQKAIDDEDIGEMLDLVRKYQGRE